MARNQCHFYQCLHPVHMQPLPHLLTLVKVALEVREALSPTFRRNEHTLGKVCMRAM